MILKGKAPEMAMEWKLPFENVSINNTYDGKVQLLAYMRKGGFKERCSQIFSVDLHFSFEIPK